MNRLDPEVDVTLAVMDTLRAPETTFTLREIAEVTGLTWQGVRNIERRALKKLLRKLRLAGYREAVLPKGVIH